MKRLFVVVSGLTLFLSVLLIGGCKEENSVQITAPTGVALYVFPHECYLMYDPDTASALITVALRDLNNQFLTGIAVELSLADSQAGGIRFVDDSLRNTTNGQGEVHLRYLMYQGGPDNTVTASVQGVSDSCRVTSVIRNNDPYSLLVWVDPETLHVSAGGTDSARVEVELRDPYSSPVEHYLIYLSTNGGSLDVLMPTTGADGMASTWWRTDGTYGTYHIVAYGHECIDTTWVCVQPELEL